MNRLDQRVAEISDGFLTRGEIAAALGVSVSSVKRALARNPSIPRRSIGPPSGERNPAWVGGRIIDLDGYVCLKVKPRRVLEHRAVAAQMLGRELTPEEVVDHIDGITIHNDPSNLRVFASNGEHLRETTSGRPKSISVAGRRNVKAQKKHLVGSVLAAVDTYRRRKERGDVRLRAILRGWLELDKDSPHLWGTRHWLEQSGIDPDSRPSLERAWDDLERRYALDLL